MAAGAKTSRFFCELLCNGKKYALGARLAGANPVNASVFQALGSLNFLEIAETPMAHDLN